MFDMVIINDDLERAYEELKEILDEVSEAAHICCYKHVITQLAVSESFFSPLFIQEIKKVQEAKS